MKVSHENRQLPMSVLGLFTVINHKTCQQYPCKILKYISIYLSSLEYSYQKTVLGELGPGQLGPGQLGPG